jgi:hypothetical protein
VTAQFYADPNSGYRCTLAADDMKYSTFIGTTFEDRQVQPYYKMNPATDTLCWGDPGAGCDHPIMVPVLCQSPGECAGLCQHEAARDAGRLAGWPGAGCWRRCWGCSCAGTGQCATAGSC